MQNRKEEPTEFEKTIKNKLHKLQDWWVSFEYKHLCIARLIVYFTCLAAVVSVCFYLFQYFNLYHTDASSARYMLSALVQSQAAIVAIVITFTLIAVQLTASAYSPRVIDIFKKNPDMWLLLGFYGFSIFFGFIVLKLVVGAEGEAVSQSAILSHGSVSISFEFCVSLAYWLGAFTFVALFPYMLNIIGLLKSENIIKRLAIEITKDKILNSQEDPVQPIMDIIYGSIMKYDLETTRVGLKAVTDRVIKIINSDDEEEISGHFCKHLERVGKLAVSRMDEESTQEVIGQLDFFGESTAEKGLQCATAQTAAFLSAIGVAAADKGLVVATWRAVEFLEAVGKAAVDKGLKKATWHVALSLGVFGRSTAEKGLVDATRQIAWTLEAVGRTAAGKRFKSATKKVAISLGDVGKAAAGKGLESATQRVVESLAALGRTAVEKRLEEVAREAAKNLASLTLSSEEIVETAIKTYESKFKEQDRDSFQKFMEIYEQKLEELRAEN